MPARGQLGSQTVPICADIAKSEPLERVSLSDWVLRREQAPALRLQDFYFLYSRCVCPCQTALGRARRPAPTAVRIYFHHSRDVCPYRTVYGRRGSLPLRVLTSNICILNSDREARHYANRHLICLSLRHALRACHLPRQGEERVTSDFWLCPPNPALNF